MNKKVAWFTQGVCIAQLIFAPVSALGQGSDERAQSESQTTDGQWVKTLQERMTDAYAEAYLAMRHELHETLFDTTWIPEFDLGYRYVSEPGGLGTFALRATTGELMGIDVLAHATMPQELVVDPIDVAYSLEAEVVVADLNASKSSLQTTMYCLVISYVDPSLGSSRGDESPRDGVLIPLVPIAPQVDLTDPTLRAGMLERLPEDVQEGYGKLYTLLWMQRCLCLAVQCPGGGVPSEDACDYFTYWCSQLDSERRNCMQPHLEAFSHACTWNDIWAVITLGVMGACFIPAVGWASCGAAVAISSARMIDLNDQCSESKRGMQSCMREFFNRLNCAKDLACAGETEISQTPCP